MIPISILCGPLQIMKIVVGLHNPEKLLNIYLDVGTCPKRSGPCQGHPNNIKSAMPASKSEYCDVAYGGTIKIMKRSDTNLVGP